MDANCLKCEHSAGPCMETHGSPYAIKCSVHDRIVHYPKEGSCVDFKKKEKESMNIIERIGTPAALEQLAEECCELGQAALKMARKLRGDNPTPKTYDNCMKDFNEEVADVMVCLESLVDSGFISNESIESVMILKGRRWQDRLDGKEN